ncbi:MAG TPA: HAMP domain-containing sensor histidine kinase [Pirellulales bacterium]|nr:HAMP domain-containing sensor histidine kinase [Pirellulales bacterium]
MSERRRLLVFSIFVLSSIALAGVGITAYHCLSFARGNPGAGSIWQPIWLSVFTTLIVIVAGGTLLVRVVNPFIRVLQDVKGRLEWKAAEMDHFVRALSHDMTANSLLLESTFHELRASCGREPAPSVKTGLSLLEACLGETQRFLEDLRELAKSGSVPLESDVIDLAGAIQDVVAEQTDLLSERAIRVTVERDIPRVWCNENRVKQVLTNLLRNAAKHGGAAIGPRITIGLGEPPCDAPRGDFVWLRVFDNGRGIPLEHRQEIFLPGKRLATAHPDGTGMGLSIVKKVIDHYGATIFVDPALTSGTAFVFGLPRASVEPLLNRPLGTAPEASAASIPAPRRVRRLRASARRPV